MEYNWNHNPKAAVELAALDEEYILVECKYYPDPADMPAAPEVDIAVVASGIAVVASGIVAVASGIVAEAVGTVVAAVGIVAVTVDNFVAELALYIFLA